MLAGEPDAGNLQVRFDEGEQRDWRKPPVALYSTGELTTHPQTVTINDAGTMGFEPQDGILEVAPVAMGVKAMKGTHFAVLENHRRAIIRFPLPAAVAMVFGPRAPGGPLA